jgi:hypothetical protein
MALQSMRTDECWSAPMARPYPHVFALLAGVGVALMPTALLADCPDGVRATTPAEREFSVRALAAAAAALPNAAAPVERVRAVDFGKLDPVSDLCSGTRTGGFEVEAGASYVRKFSPAEIEARNARRRALEKQIEQLRALPPERQAEQDALNRQARAVYDTVPRRSRKDPPFTPEQQAIVDQRSAEGRALEDKARRVQVDHSASVEPQVAPLREQAYALDTSPQQLSVTIVVNPPEWDLRPERNLKIASFGAMLKSPGGGLAVKQVAVIVRGPDGAAKDALFAAVDQDYLRGLLNKPLPDVAESRERAARVAAVTVPLEASGAVAEAGGSGGADSSVTASSGAAPAATGGATAAATTAATPTAGAAKPKCPPPAGASGAREAGGEVGGAVLGGGYGRSVGQTIGGALGALGSLGGSKKKDAPPADCVP